MTRHSIPALAGLALCLVTLPELGALVACTDGGSLSQLTLTPPSEVQLDPMIRRNANNLGRVSCAGCPERWNAQACGFTDQLMRTDAGVGAARCAAVTPAVGAPGVPQLLPDRARKAVETTEDELNKDQRYRDVDKALLLYAFGSDLQRVGSLDQWSQGLTVRTQALAWLARARADDTWPSELLALEAAAPAPARVTSLGVLDAYNQQHEHDVPTREALAEASDLAIQAVRTQESERRDAVRRVRDTLAPAWEQKPSIDMVDALEAAQLVREHSIELALNAALSRTPHCPDSLKALVPTYLHNVPDGWALDVERCTARRSDGPAAKVVPAAPEAPEKQAPEKQAPEQQAPASPSRETPAP